MVVSDLFSKRQKRACGEMPDVYFYDDLPESLREQIIQIIEDIFDVVYITHCHAAIVFKSVKKVLLREYGLPKLVEDYNEQCWVFDFFLSEPQVNRALDVVELCFNVIHGYILDQSTKTEFDGAVSELNTRFKEHGVGYMFESGQIVRVDSQFLHAEAVKPTLEVLGDKNFEGANEEFLKAHEHYRHGRYKECLVEALKAFESTMKTICMLRVWPTQPADTAKKLIATCKDNGLFPAYFNSQFSSICLLLESGVPTVRNKNGGHGQGAALVTVPEYLARYTLNLTATTILFMVEAHRAKK